MKLVELRAFRGPSIYHSRPALVGRLECEREAASLEALQALHEKLVTDFSGLKIFRGMSLAQIVENFALELMDRAGISLSAGEKRRTDRDTVVLPYFSKKATRSVLMNAVDYIAAIMSSRDYAADRLLQDVRSRVREAGLSYNTLMLVRAAEARGIPWRRLPRPNLIQLGYGKRRRLLKSSWTDRTSLIATELACHKHLARKALAAAGVPVARGYLVRSKEQAREASRKIGGPVVVKPVTGKQGIAITIGVNTASELETAFELASEHCPEVLIEEYLHGRDYRVLMMEGRFVAAVERDPAHVIGDGVHSLQELLEIENRNPLRGEGHLFPMSRIRFGKEEDFFLRQSGRTLSEVPPAGAKVYFRKSANGSAGGTARDVTDEVHPAIRDICEMAARAIGLDVCGVDLIAPDISAPGGHCFVLEVNPRPGLQQHLRPREGKSRDVAGALLDMLYPANSSSRIPIVALLGGASRTVLARVLAEELSDAGLRAGVGSDSSVLSDPIHEVAVMHFDVDEISERGLPYDFCDIAILCDASLKDHPAGRLFVTAAALNVSLRADAPDRVSFDIAG